MKKVTMKLNYFTKTISILILFFVVKVGVADNYSRADHLDSIIGYKYIVDYDTVYYELIDTLFVSKTCLSVYYNEFNWNLPPEKLFYWKMNSIRHYNFLNDRNSRVFDKYYKYESIKREEICY